MAFSTATDAAANAPTADAAANAPTADATNAAAATTNNDAATTNNNDAATTNNSKSASSGGSTALILSEKHDPARPCKPRSKKAYIFEGFDMSGVVVNAKLAFETEMDSDTVYKNLVNGVPVPLTVKLAPTGQKASIWYDKTFVEGKVSDDSSISGKNARLLKAGCSYFGTVQNGIPSGHGVIVDGVAKYTHKGIFEGEAEGRGTRTYANGLSMSGHFSENFPDGRIVVKPPNNKAYVAYYESGIELHAKRKYAEDSEASTALADESADPSMSSTAVANASSALNSSASSSSTSSAKRAKGSGGGINMHNSKAETHAIVDEEDDDDGDEDHTEDHNDNGPANAAVTKA
jgi:hypothetical protein